MWTNHLPFFFGVDFSIKYYVGNTKGFYLANSNPIDYDVVLSDRGVIYIIVYYY